jgi:hypothetical protein
MKKYTLTNTATGETIRTIEMDKKTIDVLNLAYATNNSPLRWKIVVDK